MTTVGSPAQQLILHQPGPLVECQTSQFSWEGNVGDTGILIYPGTLTEGGPLEFLPIVPAALTTTTWLVDQCGGFDCTFLLHDISTGASSAVHVSVAPNPDGDTSCDGKDPQFDPRGSSPPSGSASTTTPSGTGQPTSSPSTTSDQSPVGPPSASRTGLIPSTDTSPTQPSSPVSKHPHASAVGPIVGAVCALLIVAGIGALLYMRRRKHIRTQDFVKTTSGEVEAFAREPAPGPVAKRPLVIMSAEDPEPPLSAQQPLASLREENAVLGEENAVLRAVIARMQTSLPAPGDSETLPSYDSHSVH
ncbi:hypothetical protein EXIGLDRAFT_832521 [Exidia glandulosa HHB12029]|uniref:Uncharacterized protein n=1 Tax=Exidia glandulosa HHB12029 TaxID=1314781 RepID=A0A165LIU6_EXIGL|nr:hypothetical protein EXIGLDRAFT_832521 [Exidia glandulosa HHB12029]